MINIFKKLTEKIVKSTLSKIDFSFDLLFDFSLDFSFINENLDKIDKKYFQALIKKFEKLKLNNYINFMTNDVRLKIIEKFKKIINNIILLYTSFVGVLLNYCNVYSKVKISRAPPVKFL